MMQLVEVFGSTKECTGTEEEATAEEGKEAKAEKAEEAIAEKAEEETTEQEEEQEQQALNMLLAPLDVLASKYQCPTWFGQPLCSGLCIATHCARPITQCLTNRTCRTRLFAMNACMQRPR